MLDSIMVHRVIANIEWYDKDFIHGRVFSDKNNTTWTNI